MKAKKLTAILIFALSLISVISLIAPLEEFQIERDSMASNPLSPNSFYTYVFCTDRNFIVNGTNGQNYSTFPSGVIKLTVHQAGIQLREKIYESSINVSSIECINENYNMNSSFIQFFLNNLQINGGSFFELPYGVVGTAEKDGQNYQVIYSTSNETLLSLEEKMGVTCPWEILINNINESMVPQHDRFYLKRNPNQFDYDYSGSTNILVRAFITGNNTFLNDIFQTKGLQYSVDFSIFLVGTNVALHPLDYIHYISQFLPLLPPMWIISFLFLYLMIRNARKRMRRNDA